MSARGVAGVIGRTEESWIERTGRFDGKDPLALAPDEERLECL